MLVAQTGGRPTPTTPPQITPATPTESFRDVVQNVVPLQILSEQITAALAIGLTVYLVVVRSFGLPEQGAAQILERSLRGGLFGTLSAYLGLGPGILIFLQLVVSIWGTILAVVRSAAPSPAIDVEAVVLPDAEAGKDEE